jgi:hypothetical protein
VNVTRDVKRLTPMSPNIRDGTQARKDSIAKSRRYPLPDYRFPLKALPNLCKDCLDAEVPGRTRASLVVRTADHVDRHAV